MSLVDKNENPLLDGLEIYSRLFNHRPFLQGEIEFFLKNFQEKRGDREIENIFGVLERVSELKDFGVERLEKDLSGSCSEINKQLQLVESMTTRILETDNINEVEQTILASRECREQELADFNKDIQRRYKKIDENFLQREEELRRKYSVSK